VCAKTFKIKRELHKVTEVRYARYATVTMRGGHAGEDNGISLGSVRVLLFDRTRPTLSIQDVFCHCRSFLNKLHVLQQLRISLLCVSDHHTAIETHVLRVKHG
jgi:hypothetical protein